MQPAHNVSHARPYGFEEQGPPSVEIPISVDLGAFADVSASYVVHDVQPSVRQLRRGAVVRSDGGVAAFAFMALLTAATAGLTLAAIAYLHLDERRPAQAAVATSTVSSTPTLTTSTEAKPFVVASPAFVVVSAQEPAPAAAPVRAAAPVPSNTSTRAPSRRASSPAAKAGRPPARAVAETDTRLAMVVAANPY